jgi:transcriptional regulator with XRE-family HTH domain
MNSKERLLEFLKYLHLGQNAFERKVGLSNGHVSRVSSSFGSDVLAKIKASYPELNLTWLITGEEGMIDQRVAELPQDIKSLHEIIYSQQRTIEELTKKLAES